VENYNNKTVYLDNAGSTQVSEECIKSIEEVCSKYYANPSAIHKGGSIVTKYIDESKRKVASLINAETSEIHFTSGGTESNNLSLIGGVYANKNLGNHIITTKIEHASLKNSALALQQEGYEVTFLDVDSKGYVDLKELEEAIKPTTILVSIMHVNNEIGTIQNIDEIGALIKRCNANTLFHVDAVQSFAKYAIDVKKAKIDLLSMSGHKIHAFKGIGAVYVKNGVKVKNLLYGGSQEGGLRAGTENVPGIIAMGVAAEFMQLHHNEIVDKLKRIKNKYYEELVKNIDELYLNGPDLEEGAYHLLNVHIKGIKSQILINALSEVGIYISAGSACSAKNRAASGTLIAIGLPLEDVQSSIRISFSRYTNEDDIDFVVQKIKESVEKIRKVASWHK